MDSSSKSKSPLSLHLLIFKQYKLIVWKCCKSFMSPYNQKAFMCCWNRKNLIPGCVAIFHEFLEVHIANKLPVFCLIKLKNFLPGCFNVTNKLPVLKLNWNSFLPGCVAIFHEFFLEVHVTKKLSVLYLNWKSFLPGCVAIFHEFLEVHVANELT